MISERSIQELFSVDKLVYNKMELKHIRTHWELFVPCPHPLDPFWKKGHGANTTAIIVSKLPANIYGLARCLTRTPCPKEWLPMCYAWMFMSHDKTFTGYSKEQYEEVKRNWHLMVEMGFPSLSD